MKLTKAQMKKIYVNLARADHFDTRLVARMLRGQMLPFYHSSKGSIAPGVGLCSLLKKEDTLSPYHRGHGVVHLLSKGIDIKNYVAEHSGKITGCCAGRSGWHFCHPDDNVLLMSGFVGYNPTIAVGWAWAAKRENKQQVVAVCTGDGTYSEGRIHESFILANNDKLPIIYLCENNGMNQFSNNKHPKSDFADLANGYGMPGIVVDGMDVFAVAEVALKAIDRARNGEGPTLIEAKTLRAAPHAVGTPDKAGWQERDIEGIEKEFEKRNPLKLARERVLEEKLFTVSELEKIDENAEKEFDSFEKFCDDSEPADLSVEELMAEVYA